MESQASPSQNPKSNFVIWIAVGVITLAIGIGIGLTLGKYSQFTSPQISSYDDCAKDKSSTIQERYPASCITTSGQRFIQPGLRPFDNSPTTPTETADPTANWKTYTLKEMEYSLDYPADWSINTENTSQQFNTYLQYEGGPAANPNLGGLDQTQILIIASNSNLIYPQINNMQNLGAKSYSDLLGTLYSWKSVSEGNKLRVDRSGFDYVARANSTNFLFRLFTVPERESVDKITFDQILSTFRFLDLATPAPSCKPRPACLDATPRCLIPETSDMCPSNQKL